MRRFTGYAINADVEIILGYCSHAYSESVCDYVVKPQYSATVCSLKFVAVNLNTLKSGRFSSQTLMGAM